jgi:hypothetical protein
VILQVDKKVKGMVCDYFVTLTTKYSSGYQPAKIHGITVKIVSRFVI